MRQFTFPLWCGLYMGFAGGSRGKERVCQCRRYKRRGFDPWVGKIPWRRAWQPTAIFFHGLCIFRDVLTVQWEKSVEFNCSLKHYINESSQITLWVTENLICSREQWSGCVSSDASVCDLVFHYRPDVKRIWTDNKGTGCCNQDVLAYDNFPLLELLPEANWLH